MGKLDPLWAVYSDPKHRYGRWSLDEFFATGEKDVAVAMEAALRLAQRRGGSRFSISAAGWGASLGRSGSISIITWGSTSLPQ